MIQANGKLGKAATVSLLPMMLKFVLRIVLLRNTQKYIDSRSQWMNRDRFFDAYGRDRVDEEKLRIIAAAEVSG